MIRRFGLALLLLSFVAACGVDSPTGPTPPRDLEFASSLDVNLDVMTPIWQDSNGGQLYILDEVAGEGDEVQLEQVLTVRYTGWLHTGQEFDSNAEGDPFKFVVGVQCVISGWDIGLQNMRVGGQRLLVIPSGLAYGNNQVGGGGGSVAIPPNSTLVFRVELLAVEPPESLECYPD